MEENHSYNTGGRVVAGLVLILFGALFLAHNLDIIYIEHVGRYWPAVLVVIGLVKLFSGGGNSRHGDGLGWIFLGAWLFISLNGLWGFDFHNSWPILIIGWGISMLWRGLYSQSHVLTAEGQRHGN